MAANPTGMLYSVSWTFDSQCPVLDHGTGGPFTYPEYQRFVGGIRPSSTLPVRKTGLILSTLGPGAQPAVHASEYSFNSILNMCS